MKKHITLFIICFLSFGMCASAKDKDTDIVEGTYEYIMPDNQTPDNAKIIAVGRAKLAALADKYGTILSNTNITLIHEENAQTKTSFYSLGNSEVKGEWLKTLEEKVKTTTIDGKIIFVARVKGEARKVDFAQVEFKTIMLRNGKEDKCKATDNDFYDGDDFFISFRSPVKGYLAIFLLDKDRNASRIIPMDTEELFNVKANERYVFVDDDKKKLILTTDSRQEINQIYVIFSPKKFYIPLEKPLTDNSDLKQYQHDDFNHIQHLPFIYFKDFQDWLAKLRIKDNELQVATDFIKISSRK